MSIPESWRDALAHPDDLPERELLREPNRLRSYTDAFLRGDIDVHRYNALTLAELNSRVPMVPDVPVVHPERHLDEVPALRVVQPVIRPEHQPPPMPVETTRKKKVRGDVDAYVRGEIDSDEFLRRARAD